LLYERPAFPPLQRTLHIHSFRAPPSGGKIPENPHCSFSVEASVARPLSFRPVRGAPSSSALICLHSRHIVAVIVSPRSKPASSARLRSCSISRLRAAGSLKVIASLSCFHLRTPIAFLLHRLDCRLTSRTGRGIRGPGLPSRQTGSPAGFRSWPVGSFLGQSSAGPTHRNACTISVDSSAFIYFSSAHCAYLLGGFGALG
jgi:hypothetical protein